MMAFDVDVPHTGRKSVTFWSHAIPPNGEDKADWRRATLGKRGEGTVSPQRQFWTP